MIRTSSSISNQLVSPTNAESSNSSPVPSDTESRNKEMQSTLKRKHVGDYRKGTLEKKGSGYLTNPKTSTQHQVGFTARNGDCSSKTQNAGKRSGALKDSEENPGASGAKPRAGSTQKVGREHSQLCLYHALS